MILQPHSAVRVERLRPPESSGLARDRVAIDPQPGRLTLLTAPAGTGKTTTLAQWYGRSERQRLWYSADVDDRSAAVVLQYLTAALVKVAPDLGAVDISGPHEWLSAVEESGAELVVVIDDLHALHGSPAEAELATIFDRIPANLAIVAATRREPGIDLSHLRVGGTVTDIDADALRFRTWEIERLFADVYDVQLFPTELAQLESRTGGWAAGLQLFHLATRDKGVTSRRRTLDALGTRSRLTHDYLTRHVFDALPEDLQSFLLDTCVFREVRASLCDELRGEHGSQAHLRELERRQLFTTSQDDSDGFRYHEFLRSHLLTLLADRHGEPELRRRFVQAGRVLADHGHHAEAVSAFATGGDDESASAVLAAARTSLADDPGDWLDAVPMSVFDDDPWMCLAAARRHLRAGRLRAADTAYDKATVLFGDGQGADICHQERTSLRSWVESGHPTPVGWVKDLRRVAAGRALPERDPREPADHLVRAIAGLVGGDATGTRAALAALPGHASPVVHAVAELLDVISPHVVPLSSPAPAATSTVVDAVTGLGIPALSRIAQCALALTGHEADVVWAHRLAHQADIDPWTRLVARYLSAVGSLRCGDLAAAAEAFAAAEDVATALDARGLAAWSAVGAAVALDDERLLDRAESLGRRAGVDGVRAVVLHRRGRIDPTAARAAHDFALRAGFGWDGQDGPAPVDPNSPAAVPSGIPGTHEPSTRVRSFGQLEVHVGGEVVDVDGLAPRPRALLGMLVVARGRPVRREVLVEQLWPDAAGSRGTHRLQTAVSAVRGCIDPPEGDSLIARTGDGYRLQLPPGGRLDLAELDASLEAASARERAGDGDGALWLRLGVLAEADGELLPSMGTEDWIVAARDEWGARLASAAADAAKALVERGDHHRAVEVSVAGLRHDPYRDWLWKLQMDALEAAGDLAARAVTERRYQAVLAELGL